MPNLSNPHPLPGALHPPHCSLTARAKFAQATNVNDFRALLVLLRGRGDLFLDAPPCQQPLEAAVKGAFLQRFADERAMHRRHPVSWRDAVRSHAKYTCFSLSMDAEASSPVPACANAIDALSASGVIATRILPWRFGCINHILSDVPHATSACRPTLCFGSDGSAIQSKDAATSEVAYHAAPNFLTM